MVLQEECCSDGCLSFCCLAGWLVTAGKRMHLHAVAMLPRFNVEAPLCRGSAYCKSVEELWPAWLPGLLDAPPLGQVAGRAGAAVGAAVGAGSAPAGRWWVGAWVSTA